MTKTIVAALAAGMLVLGLSGKADAVSVKPNGVYAFTMVDTCEAKFTFAFGKYVTSATPVKTDNAVRVINSVANGHIGAGVGTITFTPKSASGGNFSISLTDIGGGALRINNGGVNVSTKPQSFTGTYTFTANSLTIKPASDEAMTYVMAYGQLPANGIPSSVHLVRQDPSDETANCVQAITATR